MRIACVSVSVALLAGGCALTSAQSAALAELEARMQTYEPRIAAVVDQIQAGRVPISEGAALISEMLEEREADLAAMDGIRAQSVPWYYVGGSVFVNLIQVFLLRRRGVVLDAVVRGVEAAGNKKVKASIEETSDKLRVGDAVDAAVQRIVN